MQVASRLVRYADWLNMSVRQRLIALTFFAFCESEGGSKLRNLMFRADARIASNNHGVKQSPAQTGARSH